MNTEITMKSTHELFVTLLNANVILPDFTFDDMINCTIALKKQVRATNEELVDWIAIQAPKLIKAWKDVDAL